ncbi:pitrilysin family protein [soil metagenome]
MRLALVFLAGLALALPARAEPFGAEPAQVEPRAGIEIVPVTSEGGITAWLVEDHTIPIVTLEGSFRGGASLDPADEAGATALMATLLGEGAGDLDRTGFAEALETLASSVGFSAGADGVSVSATTLAENLDETFDLLRLALSEPRFDAESLARARARQLATLRSDETNPNRLASRAFYARAFEGHPYAIPADGTLESVAALDRGAVLDAHESALARDRLMLAVVGAIGPGELGPLLDATFGALPLAGAPLPETAEAAAAGTVSVIDLDIPQSVVMFGHRGIARDDEDFIPAFIMDHILGGGGFGSRLTEEIRERRGLTYGVSTWLASSDYGWLYMGAFSSANARAAEAIELVRAEWARMAGQGVSAAELDTAKRYLTGAYPLRFDGNARIAGQILGLQTAGLGIDYVRERNALIEAVTAEDIARVARRLLDPDALSFVVVGAPEGIEQTP